MIWYTLPHLQWRPGQDSDAANAAEALIFFFFYSSIGTSNNDGRRHNSPGCWVLLKALSFYIIKTKWGKWPHGTDPEFQKGLEVLNTKFKIMSWVQIIHLWLWNCCIINNFKYSFLYDFILFSPHIPIL
jgi:hypothetical protein